MTRLLPRIAREKRGIILPIAIVLVVNLVAYVAVVRPLGIASADAANRATRAANALRAAEADVARARALVSGKAEADQELTAFYAKVLPADLTAARRMTYAGLPALARRTGVRYEARTTAIDEAARDTRLGHMTIRMVLEGDYEAIRQFLYELETAPDFVIVDDVTLAESGSSESQTLTINLSTYYRLGADAS